MAEAHVVQELHFEVEFASQEQAWAEQERLAAFIQGPALRIVEAEFDRCRDAGLPGGDGEPTEVLRLDALEIDLGEVDIADLEAQWTQRLQARLQDALAGLRARRRRAPPGAAATPAGSGSVSVLDEPAPPEPDAAAATWLTRDGAELDALLHFLQHGRLPWQLAADTDPVALALRVWRHSPQGLAARLRTLHRPQAAAQRLARQFPPVWLQALEAGLRAAAAAHPDAAAAEDAGLGPVSSTAAPAGLPAPWTTTPAAAERRLLAALRTPQTAALLPPTGPLAAWAVTAAARQPSPTLRAALRRMKALLVDDAPRLSTDDTTELLTLWQTLSRQDEAGLRQLLQHMGALARVRRRVAHLWPLAVLQQLPGLWLSSGDTAAVLASVQQTEAGVTGRVLPKKGVAQRSERPAMHGPREAWALVLRHLWAHGSGGRVSAEPLLAALHGLQPVAAPPAVTPAPGQTTVPERDGATTKGPQPARQPDAADWPQRLSTDAAALGLSPTQARVALRAQAATWAQQRVLAAGIGADSLARCLALWLPAAQAEALADLALGALPQAWQAWQAWQGQPSAEGPPADAPRRVQWCLQALARAPDTGVRAEDLVAFWWRALALQAQRSPSELLAALHGGGPGGAARLVANGNSLSGTGPDGIHGTTDSTTDPATDFATDHADHLRRAAWLRWLPVTVAPPVAVTPAPATSASAAPASLAPRTAWLRFAAALYGGDWAPAPAAWPGLRAQQPEALRRLLLQACADAAPRRRLARHSSAAMWRELLVLFMGAAEAGLLDEALCGLATAQAGLEIAVLRAQTLAWLRTAVQDDEASTARASVQDHATHADTDTGAVPGTPRVSGSGSGPGPATAAAGLAHLLPRHPPAAEAQALHRLERALSQGDVTAIAQAWPAARSEDPVGLRALLQGAQDVPLAQGADRIGAGLSTDAATLAAWHRRLARGLMAPQWREALGLFLPPVAAAQLDADLQLLARCAAAAGQPASAARHGLFSPQATAPSRPLPPHQAAAAAPATGPAATPPGALLAWLRRQALSALAAAAGRADPVPGETLAAARPASTTAPDAHDTLLAVLQRLGLALRCPPLILAKQAADGASASASASPTASESAFATAQAAAAQARRFVALTQDPAALALKQLAAALAQNDASAETVGSALQALSAAMRLNAAQAVQPLVRQALRDAGARQRLAAPGAVPLWAACVALSMPADAVALTGSGLQALAATDVDPAGAAWRLRADLLVWAAQSGAADASRSGLPTDLASAGATAHLLHRQARHAGVSTPALARRIVAAPGTPPAVARLFTRLLTDAGPARHWPSGAAAAATATATVASAVASQASAARAAASAAAVAALGARAAPDRPFEGAALLDMPRDQAVARLRRLAADSAALRAWSQSLPPAALPKVLALFLPAPEAVTLTRLLAELRRVVHEAADTPIASRTDDGMQALLLAAVLWADTSDAQALAGPLLERAAWLLKLPVPVLARRLQAPEHGPVPGPEGSSAVAPSPPHGEGPLNTLLEHWAADRRPIDLTRKAAPSPAAQQPPAGDRASAGQPGDGASAEKATADDAAVALLVRHLRGAAPAALSGPALEAAWLALAAQPQHPARGRLERELESAPAAQQLALALAPSSLLRVVAWLRPADAATLQAIWPGLQALSPTWPPVARAVLRELFEEDRPLDPTGLLQRTEAALRRATPQAPAASRQAPSAPWLFDSLPGEPLFITNAGLVLAGPFLPRLFGLLGLLADQRFVDDAAAERAVLLTQYAVTGQTQAAEPVLQLNKLLCGVPLQMPVRREIEATAAEREAVDGMLLAMIGHWTALGTTSLAGLRQTYLQREGRLEHGDDRWQLQVQPNTFDVLLDRLPWGYATVKFPWMPEVLHVDWR